eukprot:1729056-Rhodomonas_salina.1
MKLNPVDDLGVGGVCVCGDTNVCLSDLAFNFRPVLHQIAVSCRGSFSPGGSFSGSGSVSASGSVSSSGSVACRVARGSVAR